MAAPCGIHFNPHLMLVCIAQSVVVAGITQACECRFQLVSCTSKLDCAHDARTSSETSVECRHMEQGL